jgi:hypothetical protein
LDGYKHLEVTSVVLNLAEIQTPPRSQYDYLIFSSEKCTNTQFLHTNLGRVVIPLKCLSEPIIPDTGETKIERVMVRGHSRQKVSETPISISQA